MLLSSAFEMPQEKFLVSKPEDLHVPEVKGTVMMFLICRKGVLFWVSRIQETNSGKFY